MDAGRPGLFLQILRGPSVFPHGVADLGDVLLGVGGVVGDDMVDTERQPVELIAVFPHPVRHGLIDLGDLLIEMCIRDRSQNPVR